MFVLLIALCILIIVENISNEYFKKIDNHTISIKGKNNLQTDDEFFSTDFSNKRTIFLLGSSQIGHINVTQVNNIILPEDTIIVYNLAKPSDTPYERLKELDKIILANPEIVFYGISYRDFSFPYQKETVPILPSFQQIDSCALSLELYSTLPSNPQGLIRNILQKIFLNNIEKQSETQLEKITIEKTPFYSYTLEPMTPTSLEIEFHMTTLPTGSDSITPYLNTCALHTIVSTLNAHGIKVIILTTPLHKYYLDSLSYSQKSDFSTLLNDLIIDYELKIYKFEEKYSELNVWTDESHISTNRNVTIFNEDIAEMVKRETRE